MRLRGHLDQKASNFSRLQEVLITVFLSGCLQPERKTGRIRGLNQRPTSEQTKKNVSNAAESMGMTGSSATGAQSGHMQTARKFPGKSSSIFQHQIILCTSVIFARADQLINPPLPGRIPINKLKIIEQKLERVVQVVDKPPSVLSGSDTRPQKHQPPDPSCFNGIRIQNLKEPDHELSSDNMESDMAKVRTILNDLCGEETSVADLYRIGKKKK